MWKNTEIYSKNISWNLLFCSFFFKPLLSRIFWPHCVEMRSKTRYWFLLKNQHFYVKSTFILKKVDFTKNGKRDIYSWKEFASSKVQYALISWHFCEKVVTENKCSCSIHDSRFHVKYLSFFFNFRPKRKKQRSKNVFFCQLHLEARRRLWQLFKVHTYFLDQNWAHETGPKLGSGSCTQIGQWMRCYLYSVKISWFFCHSDFTWN